MHGVSGSSLQMIADAVGAGLGSAFEVSVVPVSHAGPEVLDGADLVVAGAYSHLRLQEWVLGGVTQTLVDDCSKFVLFRH